MKIKSTKTHTITFQVMYFESQEGGMSTDSFGKECNDLGAAIDQLALAEVYDPNPEWKIVCNVHTDISST